MKNYYYLLLLATALISCTSKPKKEEIVKLNGYWEIEKVEFPDGNKKEYKVNEFIDLISIKNNIGIRQKVAPQLDGSFLKGTLQDTIKVVDSANCYYLKTDSKFTKWEEKILSVSDERFVIENEAKIVYHFKKFVPYEKRKL
jgi:hypothetical protein